MLGCGKDNKHAGECPAVEVLFSPRGGVTESMVTSIDEAKQSVRIHAFAFTSVPIVEALLRAKERDLTVEAVVDRENLRNPNSVINKLNAHGIPVYIDSKHAIQHNKVIIIDNTIVFTGSFNLSKGAEENNAENSVAITDTKIAELYFENFNLHKEHSKPYSVEH